MLRKEVVETSQFLHRHGWVANHDGNVTVRGEGNRFLATPTATSKRLVEERGLVEVDGKGQVQGSGKVFGEIGLHLCVYERRPDVGAVVHAHPPYATAVASSRGNAIERPFIAEALVSLGPVIPKLPYTQPGESAKQALAPWCELVDAVLLSNHGVITWGKDCEQALLRMELVEHLAKIATAAMALGGIEPLPESAITPLLQARAKAGIGRAADKAIETASRLMGRPGVNSGGGGGENRPEGRSDIRPVVACAPAPHSNVPTIAPGGAKPQPKQDLATIVREEIVKALRGS